MRLRHAAWIIGLCLLAGCAPRLVGPAGAPSVETRLEAGHSLGQTFVAQHDGLYAVDVFLWPEEDSEGQLLLNLSADPQATEGLAVAQLPLDRVTEPGFYHFVFNALPESEERYYYASISLTGTGAVNVGSESGETYLDGAQYADGQPVDRQTLFRLHYAQSRVMLELGRTLAAWLGALGVGALLFVLPGWALIVWLWPGHRLAWAEKLGIAVGVSLALYPLLMAWTDLVDLKLGPLYAWLPVVGGLAALGVTWRWRERPAVRGGWAAENRWPDLALVAVIGFVFGARFWVVRLLEAPLWGDSVQHTAITQLMIDNGGLFSSWLPYAPYATLRVHFGFPALAAVYSWLTGTNAVQSTLLVGQIVNGLAALAVYPLAVRVAGGNRWAGVGAVLVAGLLSPMPAYYVNWGRYAQLAGQAILPAALWLLWEAVDSERFAWGKVGLAGGALAGMLLAYYRMPFYYATFVLAWLIGVGLPRWRAQAGPWRRAAVRLAAIGGAGLLLFLPWGIRIARVGLAGDAEGSLIAGSPLAAVLADYGVWHDILIYVPGYLIAAALAALALSVLQRRWAVASIGLWVLALALLVAARLVRLPGANQMQNYAVVIALYIPVALLVGWLLGQTANFVLRPNRASKPLALTVLVVGVAAWAMFQQVRLVQADRDSSVMVTRPDSRAMTWILDNTPPDSRFLVESFRVYNGVSAVGSDAGWWIPLLAGRENTLPPQYALTSEAPFAPDYTQRVVALVKALETESLASPAGLQLLCDWGITHVYIGQGQGLVSREKIQLYSPEELLATTAYRLVYHQDRVYVFAVDGCGAGA